MLEHVDRRIEAVLTSRLREEPVIAIQGPRSVGKSTLLVALADRHDVQVLDLDNPAVRDAVDLDPGSFVGGPAPVCIDEYQKAPVVLDAIKAELNRRTSAGRFVITGSTRFDALPRAAQALTGRLHLLSLLPFSQGEIDGSPEDFLDVALTSPAELLGYQSNTYREEYVERACRGGMPLAVSRTQSSRDRWFDDYVRVSLERDVLNLSRIRQPELMPVLLQRLAGQTAQVLNMAAAGRSAGLEARTAESYTKLLEDLFLVTRLPAWGRTLRARATSAPKIHVVDSGLAARLLRLSPERLGSLDPAGLTEFGHLLESFVVGEITKQISWSDRVSGLGHWRTHDGQEVDLVVEHSDGSVTAFEVKASARVTKRDGRGLRALRDSLGDRFNAGIVLSTGELSFRLEDRIQVVPIDRLWKN